MVQCKYQNVQMDMEKLNHLCAVDKIWHALYRILKFLITEIFGFLFFGIIIIYIIVTVVNFVNKNHNNTIIKEKNCYYLNIELRRLRSTFFKKYLENYQRALSSRDVEKYVDGEADVVDYEKIINEFALLRNKWLGLLKGLDQKQWQITNVVKLRVAGMEDASL